MNSRFNKKLKLILTLIYAFILFFAIQNDLNTTILLVLFVLMPILIYLFVNMIFPKNNKN